MADKILITSALPYVNNAPHLGNIIGCVLSADVFARFCRLKGYDVLYVCGTDEHGTTTEAKAFEEGLTPQQICDKYYKIHKDVYEWFGCSFDCFGRTSTKTHKEVTQDIFLRLHKNGYIIEDDVEQLFCVKCNKFLADRFVEGKCPECSYGSARGDQCEKCGKLLNAIELVEPKCKICSTKPVVRKSKHLFLNLKKLSPELEKWFEKQSKEGAWSENAVRVTKAWFHEGLKERCISRDLKWGVPIPLEKYKDKVFYVWFDAPIGYISITKHAVKNWNEWWLNKSVKLYQFMAKDNIPFHTILFPATLMGAKQHYAMLYHINSTEYLNYEDGKFSKSKGIGVFGDDAIATGIPPDVWRYYLLTNRPENADSHFSWKDFQEKNNNELLANLGNFINRALVFVERYFGGIAPGRDEKNISEKDKRFINHLDGKMDEITRLIGNVKLKDSLREVMQITKLANQYFQENEPWALVKNDKKRCGAVLNICVNVAASLAVLIEPFMPFTSAEIFNQLNLKKQDYKWESALTPIIKKGHKIGKPKPLFRKLEDKEIEGLKERFGGSQASRKEEKSGKTEKTEKQEKTEKLEKLGRTEKMGKSHFAGLDLRIAKIEKAEDHPNADKLYVLQIDLGEMGRRQICAGLKKYYKKDELNGRKIVVVANLKPAKLRGIESIGMLLVGFDRGKDMLELLGASACKTGEQVFADGIKQEPKKQVELWEFEEAKMAVKNGKVLYDGMELKTKSGKISVSKVKDGIVC